MKYFIIGLVLSAFFASCGGGNYSSRLDTPTDSVSYVIGEALFRSFDNKGLFLNPEQLRQGYLEARDSVTYLTFEESQRIIQQLENEMVARNEPFTPEDQPEANLDTLAYAMGADLGFRFNTLELQINPDALYNGVKDYADHGAKGSRLPGALYDIQYEKYENWIKKAAAFKKAEKATKNQAEAEAWFRLLAQDESVIQLKSGLMYKVLEKGTGPIPKRGDSVLVYYQGRLPDGEVFDETREGETAGFWLKEGVILPGWLQALTMMPKGSRWQLYIPSQLAYGARGFYDIEPNQALEFDVELVEIRKGPK